MKTFILPDDHDLCIRTFLSELDALGLQDLRSGVLHVGAHMGEEVKAYEDYSYSPIYLVEANPEILPGLSEKFKGRPNIHILSTAVGSHDGIVEFVVHKTLKGGMESSGLLKLDRLGEIVPVFNSDTSYSVPITTIDRLSDKLRLAESIKLMVLDIQGAELLALSGANEFLNQVSAVICEVNLIENYKGGAMEAEVDKIFAETGFVKHLAIYHELYDHTGRFPAWGECLWYKPTTSRLSN